MLYVHAGLSRSSQPWQQVSYRGPIVEHETIVIAQSTKSIKMFYNLKVALQAPEL